MYRILLANTVVLARFSFFTVSTLVLLAFSFRAASLTVFQHFRCQIVRQNHGRDANQIKRRDHTLECETNVHSVDRFFEWCLIIQ